MKDALEEAAPDVPQLLEQMVDEYHRVEEVIRVAIPFCETDGPDARKLYALAEDISEQIAAVTAYRKAEIERRANAERDRINQAAQERKSSAEQEQRANAERDRINQAAQKRRADEQAVQYEANAAFFAEKEQEQQARAEQKTPSIGEQIEGRWKQIEGSAAYKQVATAALWISLIIVFLLVVGECGGSGNPYDCRPPMTMSPDGVCWHPG
jgi:uncharacterized membrane-anchored protein